MVLNLIETAQATVLKSWHRTHKDEQTYKFLKRHFAVANASKAKKIVHENNKWLERINMKCILPMQWRSSLLLYLNLFWLHRKVSQWRVSTAPELEPPTCTKHGAVTLHPTYCKTVSSHAREEMGPGNRQQRCERYRISAETTESSTEITVAWITKNRETVHEEVDRIHVEDLVGTWSDCPLRTIRKESEVGVEEERSTRLRKRRRREKERCRAAAGD